MPTLVTFQNLDLLIEVSVVNLYLNVYSTYRPCYKSIDGFVLYSLLEFPFGKLMLDRVEKYHYNCNGWMIIWNMRRLAQY